MSDFVVERHVLVERDLRRLIAFLLNYTNMDSVRAKLTVLERDIAALAQNPYRGTKRDDILPGLRILPSAGKGVIAFQLLETRRRVRVLSISWAGADWRTRATARR